MIKVRENKSREEDERSTQGNNKLKGKQGKKKVIETVDERKNSKKK